MQVRGTSKTIAALHLEEVDLARPGILPGYLPALRDWLDDTKALGEALDLAVGLSSNSTVLAVALDVTLFTKEIKQWVLGSMKERHQSRQLEQQDHEEDLAKHQTALQDASSVNPEIEVSPSFTHICIVHVICPRSQHQLGLGTLL